MQLVGIRGAWVPPPPEQEQETMLRDISTDFFFDSLPQLNHNTDNALVTGKGHETHKRPWVRT